MPSPSEYTLAEKPSIDILLSLGYRWLRPGQNDAARDGQNQVLLRDGLIEAVQRINGVSEDVARAVYHDLIGVVDNERWTLILRGNYSRQVPGESTRKTIRLVDFRNPANNVFTVTNQLTVIGNKTHRPDLVLFLNGIPVVVIEAKSPVSTKDKTGEGFEQIRQYETNIPRLFYSNAFNIVTRGISVFYGATGSPSQFWGEWRDPWPRIESEFATPLEKGLYSLLEPSRLLDLIAHFIVFERRESRVVKKLARYQQFRAVNKMVERVIDRTHRRGLIWHTQGSGKSLTMVFAALKLKTHLTIDSPSLSSPNILVLTDRIDLDNQISGTFTACGLPNPKQIDSVADLHAEMHAGTRGLVMLSTIFKFEGSRRPVADSGNWVILVDECHRTQEKDLGAFLRATFPEAFFFGFTGTPVKKSDTDTYRNFGAPGEGYLDRYSIDDAVADGATVPIRYTSRKTGWEIDPAKLDILFDQWFADEPEEYVEKIKERGVTIAELAKHPRRVELNTFDIWTHFQGHAMPDGYKAQIVAIDREAVVLYKRALDAVIAATLVKQGLSPDDAAMQATAMSACVVSSSQEDGKPSEDRWIDAIRRDLVRWSHDSIGEKEVIERFNRRTDPLRFLIVCNKLLTGFDAPIESVMYLDNPLREHNLLQAIARTNRVDGALKQYGLIVDYIGVTRKLDEALESYRSADVKNALVDLDADRENLKAAHREIMLLVGDVRKQVHAIKEQYDLLVQRLGTEDEWFAFRRKGKIFTRAYEALSPDPSVLDYRDDMKWIAGFLAYGTWCFEKKEALDLKSYSAKIREMLHEQLVVTGITTICKLRSITDPEFTVDFKPGKTAGEIRTAAIRKSAELKKILAQKMADNPTRYAPFSERVLATLERFEKEQIDAAEALKEYEGIVKDLAEEEQSHEGSGLSERAYNLYTILQAFKLHPDIVAEPAGNGYGVPDGNPVNGGNGLQPNTLQRLAAEIDEIYTSERTAPPGWHLKEGLRKELRQDVRRRAHLARLNDIAGVAERVEEYALRCYARV